MTWKQFKEKAELRGITDNNYVIVDIDDDANPKDLMITEVGLNTVIIEAHS